MVSKEAATECYGGLFLSAKVANKQVAQDESSRFGFADRFAQTMTKASEASKLFCFQCKNELLE